MTPRTLLLSALLLPAAALLLAGADLTDAEWARLRREALERPRTVIYDNDGDDVNYHHGTPTVEKLLAKRTTWQSKYPTNTIVYCINGSTFAMKIPTKNGDPDVYEWNASEKGPDSKPGNLNAISWLFENNVNILQLQIDFARKHGKEIFAEFRLNDTHDHYHSPLTPCPYFAPFKEQHPEFLCGSYDNQSAYASWTSYNFACPEIRQRFVALVAEVADSYDLDGIFIDTYRWLNIFKSVAWGGEASQEERDAFTEMFRQIRTATEAAGRRRGRPVLLAIRLPDSLRYCNAIGIDWERLMAEHLVDMVFPAGNSHFEPWGNSVDLCHKYGVKCYPSIDMPSFETHEIIRTRLAPECYFGRIAAAYQAGADGIFFYNLFVEALVREIMPPSAEAIRLESKRIYISPLAFWSANHSLANGERFNLLPEMYYGRYSTLRPGKTLAFRVENGDDLAALQAEGILVEVRATLIAEGGTPGSVQISSNGVPWRYVSSHKDRHTYQVPPEAITPGVNEIVFNSLAKDAAPKATEIMSGEHLLTGERQPPWRRIFQPPLDNADNESIVDGAYRFEDKGNGTPNIVYPISQGVDSDIVVTFEARAEASDDPLAVMLRLAGNGKVECFCLQPGRIGFYYADKYIDFDAENFHSYRIAMRHGKIAVEADGKALLEAPLAMASASESAALRGMSYVIPGMNERSIIVGSMADKGRGVGYWRHLTTHTNAGNVILQDFWLDIRINQQPPKEREMSAWEHSATAQEMLSAGNFAYYTHPVVAECELLLDDESAATIVLSSGGLFAQVALEGLRLPLQGIALPQKADGIPYRLRIEMDDKKGIFFIDGTYCDTLQLENVTLALKHNSTWQELDKKSGGLVRASGIMVLPKGNAKVAALRAQQFPQK